MPSANFHNFPNHNNREINVLISTIQLINWTDFWLGSARPFPSFSEWRDVIFAKQPLTTFDFQDLDNFDLEIFIWQQQAGDCAVYARSVASKNDDMWLYVKTTAIVNTNLKNESNHQI